MRKNDMTKSNQNGDSHDSNGTDRSLFDERDRRTFEAAVDEWGIEAQVNMAEEEAAEFIVASRHFAREKADEDDVIDELADLRIMSEQLTEFIGRERVENRVRTKMNRLRERLPCDVQPDTEHEENNHNDDNKSGHPTCQYLGSEEIGIDTEIIRRDGSVGCVAEATTAIRPARGSLRYVTSPRGKMKMCLHHARWLTSDETERAWERCGDLKTGTDHD